MKRALRLDPLSMSIMFNISRAYANVGEYDSAFVYVRRGEEIWTETATTWWISEAKCYIYLLQGKYAEAIEEGKKAVSGKAPLALEMLASAYALSGQTDKAQELLAELFKSIGDRYYSPAFIATVYCALGDREKVLEYSKRQLRNGISLWSHRHMFPPGAISSSRIRATKQL